jgi:hypothetical protein
MIFTWILALFTGFLSFLLGLLPSFTGPSTTGWSEWFSTVGGYLQAVNRWVNVGLLVTLLGLLGAILVVYAAVKAVTWLMAHIPFFATADD